MHPQRRSSKESVLRVYTELDELLKVSKPSQNQGYFFTLTPIRHSDKIPNNLSFVAAAGSSSFLFILCGVVSLTIVMVYSIYARIRTQRKAQIHLASPASPFQGFLVLSVLTFVDEILQDFNDFLLSTIEMYFCRVGTLTKCLDRCTGRGDTRRFEAHVCLFQGTSPL